MSMQSSQTTLIIGPSSAGKTVLLASLQHAALVREQHAHLRVRVLPDNEETAALFRSYATLIAGAPAPKGDTTTIDYMFQFQIRPFWRPWWSVTRFVFRDGPGGSIFRSATGAGVPDAHVVAYQQLLEQASCAQSLVVCADASNVTTAEKFFTALPAFLNDVRFYLTHQQKIVPQQRGIRSILNHSHSNPTYRRIVLCVTKADKAHRAEGRGALTAALSADPREVARHLLTEAGYNALRQSAPHAKIGACSVSAFGFIAGEGSANFDPATEGLLTISTASTAQERVRAIDAWRPFQVLDPFLFIAGDQPESVHVFYRERWWHPLIQRLMGNRRPRFLPGG